MGERDFIALIDGVHQLLKAPIVLVWDRLNTHVSRTMGELIAEREWLTVFLLPAYSPNLNPVEWVWAHIKRSLANLAVVALDRLEALVRNRLKRLQVPVRHPRRLHSGHRPDPRRTSVTLTSRSQ
jgi:transposase